MTDQVRAIIVRILVIMMVVFLFFLTFRFILMLFGASSSVFTFVIYGISSILVLPFINIFPDVWLIGDIVFDSVALFSIIAYLAIFGLLILLTNIGSSVIKRTTHLQPTK